MMPAAAAKLASFVLVALLNVAIRTPVVDPAGALSPPEREAIELRVRALRQHTGVQLAVLTILSTEGEPIADFSHRTAVAWGGGRKGYDDGLLLTIAVTDRRSRLEVGYGLEGKLPDAVVRRLLENARAELQHGKYGPAIIKILDHLDLLLGSGSKVASSAIDSAGSAGAVERGAETAPDSPSAAFVEPPPPRTTSSAQSQPLSPHGLLVLLALVPLFALVLGYGLGAWRCSECAPAVDVFAYLTLGAAAFIALLFGVGNPHGYYLSIALFAIGWASMFARTSGLSVIGQLVAVLLAAVPTLLMVSVFVWISSKNSQAIEHHQLLLAELVGAGTLFLVAKVITRYYSQTSLWEQSRARGTGRRFGGPWALRR